MTAHHPNLMLPYFGAHFGKSLLWYASETFIIFLLTEVIRLPVSSIGWALGLGFAVSAVIDVAIGVGFRKHLSSAPRASCLQTIGCIVSASALIILFAFPLLNISNPYSSVVLTIIVFRFAYALVDLPQNAILSTATPNDGARSRLASTRLAGSGLAALTVSVMVSVIIYHPGTERPALIAEAAVVIATIAIGSSLALKHALRHSPVATTTTQAIDPSHYPRLPGEVTLLLAVMFLTSFAAPVFAKLLPYYAAYRLHGPVLGTSTIAAVSLGMAIGQPLLFASLRQMSMIGRTKIMALATAASAIAFSAAGGGGTWAIPAAAWLFGACSAGLGAALWAAYADVVARQMVGREGLAFALLTAAAKLSLAVSGVGIGWFLSDSDFRNGTNGILLYGMTVPAIVAGLAISALLAVSARPGWPARTTGR